MKELTRKFTRKQKVILFVMKHIEDLKKMGLIGGGDDLTDKGRRNAEKIIKSGFKPTDKEMESCMDMLTSPT